MKLTIKPFKKAPSLPSDFYEHTWSRLALAVSAIQNQRPLLSPEGAPVSREELFRSVEDLCVHKFGAQCYTALKELVDAHVLSAVRLATKDVRVDVVLDDSSLSVALPLLTAVDALWQEHSTATNSIRSIFLYLDRAYALNAPSATSLFQVATHAFRQALLPLVPPLVRGLVAVVQLDLNGEAVPVALLKDLTRMLATADLYKDHFEQAFLLKTEDYFRSEGIRMMGSSSGTANNIGTVPAYLLHVQQRIKAATSNDYIDVATRPALVKVIEATLVTPHTQQLLKRGFDAMMDDQRVADLKLLYDLFKRVDKLDEIKLEMMKYIESRVLQALDSVTSSATAGATAGSTTGSTTTTPALPKAEVLTNVVNSLLKLRASIENVYVTAFASSPSFQQAIKSAFESALNHKEKAPAEYLAKFVDSKMRASKVVESDVEKILDKVMQLFRYIHGKDVFEVFYKNLLSKRLLSRKSASMDLEKFFISSLKTECGSNFTAKLEGMLKDMEIGAEIVNNYALWCDDDKRKKKELVQPLKDDACKMDLSVLTTGYWPQFVRMTDVVLPQEMQIHQQRFENYYSDKYQGRRVEWQHSLGSCVIDFRYGEGEGKRQKKMLEVSQVQALVLLAMNDGDGGGDGGKVRGGQPRNMGWLMEKTGVANKEDMVLALQSLSLGPRKKESTTRVLRRVRDETDKNITDSDTFVINHKFYHTLSKIKIPTVSNKQEEVEEERKAHESVLKDRMVMVDACVIRIMKTRKTLKHSELMEETMAQLRHPAEAADIKKRIESLIEREYMERSDGNRNVYNYLA
jgi:cullin-4